MAITLQGFSNTDWARAAQTTLARYVGDVEQTVLRQYAMGALLESRGRLEYNCTGRGLIWPVQYKLHDVQQHTGEGTRNFVRKNLWKEAFLEMRGYQVTDQITYKEVKQNSGPEGLVKVWNGFTDRLQQSLRQGLAPEYYVDGGAAGNTTSWHGLESMFAINGTVNSSTGAQRSANAADFVAYPDDTYAGIDTELGTYGGGNESGSVWPNGIADSEYDFWTPLVVNTTCTGFSPTTHTWAAQGDEAMRFAILHSNRNSNAAGQISQIFLNRTLYMELMNLLDGKEQINVNRVGAEGLVSLGFRNTIIFDGVEVTYENAVPSGVGYGVAIDAIDLKSMDSTLFRVEGPEYDMREEAYIAAVSTLSNLKFQSPRNFFKLKALA